MTTPDITDRLRATPRSDIREVMNEAAAEIERLREAIRRLAEQDATLSVCEGNVTVTMDATLTDAEREAIADAADRYAEITPESAETAATLRGLLERTRPDRPQAIATSESDRPEPINDARLAALQQLAELDEELGLPRTPNPHATPGECRVPPKWTSKPYWVDPPSGWRYGFPRLYDPASDGDMTEWMIRHGYPERLARQGLACTFTAATEDGGK